MTHSFQSTIDLLDKYYRTADRLNAQGFNRDLACELRERLVQLGWLIDQVRELEKVVEAAMKRSRLAFTDHIARVEREGLDFRKEPVPEDCQATREETQEFLEAQFRIKLYTETFYYLAGRARALVRHKEEPLPGLGQFDARGVRDVRNQLLEHPEGSGSRIFTASWGFGGPQGPVLKAIRYAGQEEVFPDPGLYANADEFKSQLETALKAASADMAFTESL